MLLFHTQGGNPTNSSSFLVYATAFGVTLYKSLLLHISYFL